jgi:hypothetical protein
VIFIRQNTPFFVIAMMGLLWGLGCSGSQNKLSVEEKLLTVFKNEIPTLEAHQNNYAGYMIHQMAHFDKTQKKTVRLIKEINEKFAALSDIQKNDYQKKWRSQFQPTLKKIAELTQTMMNYQKTHLNTENLLIIEELSLRIKKMEKNFNDVKLQPQFY